jgi:hypothetical protein
MDADNKTLSLILEAQYSPLECFLTILQPGLVLMTTYFAKNHTLPAHFSFEQSTPICQSKPSLVLYAKAL